MWCLCEAENMIKCPLTRGVRLQVSVSGGSTVWCVTGLLFQSFPYVLSHPSVGVEGVPWCPCPSRQWLCEVTCWFVDGCYDGTCVKCSSAGLL